MPAELGIPAENGQEVENTKIDSETTKEITAKMIKEESELSHGNGLQSVPHPIETNHEEVRSVPNTVESILEKTAEVTPEPVPESDTQPQVDSETPEPVSEAEPVITLVQPEPTPVLTLPEPLLTATLVPDEESQPEPAPEPVTVVQAEPAPEVQPEPRILPEVRSEIVKSLIRQTEADPDPRPPVVQNGTHKKVQMITSLDEDAVRAAYEDVRADNTDTQWAVFKFQGSCIVRSAIGSEFEKFRAQFTDNERAFGFIRVQVGDELSKRQKFVFITWVGPSVSVIQRAKMSTDKALMKTIISNFAVELQPENLSEIELEHFVKELNKAGGANYGTGVRDL